MTAKRWRTRFWARALMPWPAGCPRDRCRASAHPTWPPPPPCGRCCQRAASGERLQWLLVGPAEAWSLALVALQSLPCVCAGCCPSARALSECLTVPLFLQVRQEDRPETVRPLAACAITGLQPSLRSCCRYDSSIGVKGGKDKLWPATLEKGVVSKGDWFSVGRTDWDDACCGCSASHACCAASAAPHMPSGCPMAAVQLTCSTSSLCSHTTASLAAAASACLMKATLDSGEANNICVVCIVLGTAVASWVGPLCAAGSCGDPVCACLPFMLRPFTPPALLLALYQGGATLHHCGARKPHGLLHRGRGRQQGGRVQRV